jgi:hypothetical protein
VLEGDGGCGQVGGNLSQNGAWQVHLHRPSCESLPLEWSVPATQRGYIPAGMIADIPGPALWLPHLPLTTVSFRAGSKGPAINVHQWHDGKQEFYCPFKNWCGGERRGEALTLKVPRRHVLRSDPASWRVRSGSAGPKGCKNCTQMQATVDARGRRERLCRQTRHSSVYRNRLRHAQ